MPTQMLVKPGRARKAKGEGHERREEILAVAARLFAEAGHEGATIRRIADEVGLSSTALYMHFRDKDEMLLAICERTFEAFAAVHAEIARTVDQPVDRVRAMLFAYIGFALENPNPYRLVLCSSADRLGPQARAMVQRLGREAFDRFAAAVAQAAAQGRMKGDSDVSAQVLWAGAHGISSLLITKPEFGWTGRAHLPEAMVDALFKGLIRQ